MKQKLEAPGTIKAPEKRDNTAVTMAIIGIVLLLVVGSLCTSVLPAPGPGQLNGTTISVLLVISFPIWGGLIILFVKLNMASKKRTAQDALREAQHYVESGEQQRQQQAAHIIANAKIPEVVNGLGIIGVPIIGDLAWCTNGWFSLPEPELAKHGVIIGGSGTGKTVSLMRIAYIAAKIYNYRVFYIDGKGDRDNAAQFLATMHQVGITSTMFPRQAYNGWKGDGTAILNRLMSILDFSEPYYEDAARDVLATCIYNNPAGTPASSTNLLQRLNALLAADPKNQTTAGVVLRYRSFFGAIQGMLDNGFNYESTPAAYLLLDGLALKKQAASLGRFLIEDFAHYAARRKQPGRDLLIIDEYSAISNGADAANLIERIRSYGCSVILSSQSYAGLGEERDAERILDAANWLLVHRSAAPERLTSRAGTQQAIKEIRQFGGNLDAQIYETGRAQFEEQHALHPDHARRLGIGEALLIAHGRFIKTQITPAPQIAPNEIIQARAWIDQQHTSPQPIIPTSQPLPAIPPANQQHQKLLIKPQLPQHPPETL